MRHKKNNAGARAAARAKVIQEIGEPRMTRSARIAERNLDSARIPSHPSVTMPGTVDRIIPPNRPRQLEKAQIAVDGAHRPHRNLRIENEFIDEDGEDVKLKKGARVAVNVTAAPNE